MAGFERNGDPFTAYFRRWDVTAHVMVLEGGELAGFAISGAEGRGKVFLYELHIAAAHRKLGYASALLDLVERSSPSRSASAVKVELNVHEANADARAFYERVGFAESGKTSGGVLVMRRRR
jgi:ribosomal protein S18 acetylase RimI-like enzyme